MKAFVVLSPEYLANDRQKLTEELQAHVRNMTAPYKYPRKVRSLAVSALKTKPKVIHSSRRASNRVMAVDRIQGGPKK